MIKKYFIYLCEKNKKILLSGYLITIVSSFIYMLLGTRLYDSNNPNAISILVITIGVMLTMIGFVLFVAFSINLFYSDLFSPAGKFDYSLPISTIKKQISKQILSIASTILLLVIMLVSVLAFGIILGGIKLNDLKDVLREIIKIFKNLQFYKVAIYHFFKILAITNLAYSISIFIKPVINTKLLNVVTSLFVLSLLLKIPSFFVIKEEFLAYDVLDLMILQDNYYLAFLALTIVITIASYWILNYVENKYLEI